MDKAITQAEALCTIHMNLVGINDKVILPKRQQDLPKQTEKGRGAPCMSQLYRGILTVTALRSARCQHLIFFFLKELMYMGQQ